MIKEAIHLSFEICRVNPEAKATQPAREKLNYDMQTLIINMKFILIAVSRVLAPFWIS